MKFIKQRIPSLPLIYFRILFGLILLQLLSRYFYNGWIGKYFVKPTFYFPHFNWEWLRPLPELGMYLLFIILVLLAIFITLGFKVRISAFLFALGFGYQHLLDKSNFLNHYYLVFLLCIILFLIPSIPKEKNIFRVPRWTLWLIRFQLGVVYTYGAIAKMNLDWIIHAQPLKIWLLMNRDMPLFGPLLSLNITPYFFSYAGLIFDLAIFPFLLFSKTRKPAYSIVLFFHIITFMLFPIGMFPWIMIFLTPVCFSNRFHYRFIIIILKLKNLIQRILSTPQENEPNKFSLSNSKLILFLKRLNKIRFLPQAFENLSLVLKHKNWNFYLAILFCVLQILLPFRHFGFPGNLLWTEEGFRFSWHIMAAHKSGIVNFFVSDNSGNRIPISYNNKLTQRQLGQMSTDPGMIWQFAKFIYKEEEAKGRKDFGVYAESYVSLNGRKAVLMIDPNVDLNSVIYEYFAPTKWIFRLEEEL